MMMRLIFSFIIVVLLTPCLAFAGEHEESKAIPAVSNETYRKNCGACHFAYQPGLLPARSWVKIIDTPDGHAGGNFFIDKRAKSEIKNYLVQNSAEHSPSKRSKKILRSIGSDTPVRISEIPYIKQKHRKINQEVFSRKAVGSRANCVACHSSAARSVYEDDDVVIPN